MEAHKLENFHWYFKPVLAIAIIMFVWNLFGKFFLHLSSNIELLLSSTILVAIISFYFFEKRMSKYLPEAISVIFFVHCIVVNLVYRDQVADSFKSENKGRFDFILILIYIITQSLSQSSLKFTIFIMFPSFVLATYFQQIAITTI